jgi:hypothetical protein
MHWSTQPGLLTYWVRGASAVFGSEVPASNDVDLENQRLLHAHGADRA